LDAVSTIPSSAIYRVNVEKTTRYRLKIIQENDSVESIEAKLGVGQIEEILEQARDELELIPHMADWEPWKLEQGQSPVKIELID
jgi:NADH dehydrogenase (ubiquinone) 1 alpha subcomplex subunit 5